MRKAFKSFHNRLLQISSYGDRPRRSVNQFYLLLNRGIFSMDIQHFQFSISYGRMEMIGKDFLGGGDADVAMAGYSLSSKSFILI